MTLIAEDDLRLLVAAGRTQREMASLYGCSQSTISTHLNRRGISHNTTHVMSGQRTAHPLIIEMRNERIRRGMSQETIAERAGYRRNQIADWESGRVRINAHALCDVAHVLGFRVVLKRRRKREQ